MIIFNYRASREDEGTERDILGVGWDISIPPKLFLVLVSVCVHATIQQAVKSAEL